MPKVIGIDGYERSKEAERRLNLAAVEVLGDTAGNEFLQYLKQITINRVNGPNVSDGELRHLEGQRYLVGVIESRVQAGHREKANG